MVYIKALTYLDFSSLQQADNFKCNSISLIKLKIKLLGRGEFPLFFNSFYHFHCPQIMVPVLKKLKIYRGVFGKGNRGNNHNRTMF